VEILGGCRFLGIESGKNISFYRGYSLDVIGS
jgi:hypothetical protein